MTHLKVGKKLPLLAV